MNRLINALNEPFYIAGNHYETLLKYASGEYEVKGSLYKDTDTLSSGATTTISITGTLFRYKNILTEYGLATSMQETKEKIAAALEAGNDVELLIDSGGGTVNGTSELANFIYDNRDRITAYGKGVVGSAALWVATSAKELYVEDTTIIGSLGVMTTIMDFSGYYDKIGVKEKDIISDLSPNKRVDGFTEGGEKEIKRNLNALADIFVSSVAKNLNMEAKKVVELFESGGVITGKEAFERGLVAGIRNKDILTGGISMPNKNKAETESVKVTAEADKEVAKLRADLEKKSADLEAKAGQLQAEKVEMKRVKDLEEAFASFGSVLSEVEVAELKAREGVTASDVQEAVLNNIKKVEPQGEALGKVQMLGVPGKEELAKVVVDGLVMGAGVDLADSHPEAVKFSHNKIKPVLAKIAGLDITSSDEAYMTAMVTSDFPNLLQNAVSRVVESQFERAETTYRSLTEIVPFKDFKPRNTARRTPMSQAVWKKTPEGDESEEMFLGEQTKNSQLETYTAKFSLTRQMLINDDLGEFNRLVGEYGVAADEFINYHVYAFLQGAGDYSSYVMHDGTALFHASHGNLAGSGAAPTSTTLSAARTAMIRQTDDADTDLKVRIMPRSFVVPAELITTAEELMNSTAVLTDNKNSGVTNVFRGKFNIITDPELTSATAWYLTSNNPIQLGVLGGSNGAPIISRQLNDAIDGISYKAAIDFVVYAEKWQKLYKNVGA